MAGGNLGGLEEGGVIGKDVGRKGRQASDEDSAVGALKSPQYVGRQNLGKESGRKCGEGGAPDEECGERDGGAESAFGSIHVREEVGIGGRKIDGPGLAA